MMLSGSLNSYLKSPTRLFRRSTMTDDKIPVKWSKGRRIENKSYTDNKIDAEKRNKNGRFVLGFEIDFFFFI